MANRTSQHILNTAATLLGVCLFVITARHISNPQDINIIDTSTSVVSILLAFSCFFSFFSIKSENSIREKLFEIIADILFMVSLIGILFIILLIAFNFIK